MNTNHIIITRFSVLDEESKIFRSWKTSFPPIKENLFSEQRLNFKFMAFDKMTYPSIKNQSYTDYVWLIYSSVELPDKYKNQLEQYADNNIKIIYIKNFKEMKENINAVIKNKTNYTTIRLDDDDGLVANFLETLNKYSTQKNKIVSFPNGIKYKIDNKNNIVFGSKINRPKIALGLSAVEFNIFLAGDHRYVDQKYDMIYDQTENAYCLCCSEFCETKREFS